jgi:cytochrome c biogenesis protein
MPKMVKVLSETAHTTRPRRSLSLVLVEFLGSMNLAITMLVAIAIAAVIGTVLKQNEPYTNYVIKFGSFWFEVFKSLGLFDIYGAPWFIGLLGILLVSTAICVYRNTPTIIKDMRNFRLDVQAKSLSAFHHKAEWRVAENTEQTINALGGRLKKLGYRVRTKRHEGHTTVAAMKGSAGRLGYLLSHVSIVVICLGGLVDGNLPLRIAEWNGDIAIETRSMPVDLVPEKSVLPADNSSFRGSITIPEGSSSDIVFLGMRDGYLVQKLPFSIEVVDFRIEHYSTGMPKLFASSVIIHDDALKEPLKANIEVNHPLTYKGYAIYQSSFADGGSKINLMAWPLDSSGKAEPVNGTIGEKVPMQAADGNYMLELDDFKMFNIFPLPEGDPSGKKHQNYGPSVVFKLRAANGEAREYVNYLSPIMFDGRPFFLSGMRASTGEEYRFLHIPADDKGGVGRFMRFLARAKDEKLIHEAAQRQATRDLDAPIDDPVNQQFTKMTENLVRVFVHNGLDAIAAQSEKSVAPEKREEALSSYVKLLQIILGNVYLQQLRDEGIDTTKGISEADSLFFDDALNAISALSPYGSPFYMQFKDFKQVEASGLQITKAPGQDIVYLGFVMLMLGVFFMFYLHHRRLWLLLREDEGHTEVLLAVTGHRERGSFDNEFEFLRQDLRRTSGAIE